MSFCKKSIIIAWEWICSRMSQISLLSSSGTTSEFTKKQDISLIWWRNYIIFACVTSGINNITRSDSSKEIEENLLGNNF